MSTSKKGASQAKSIKNEEVSKKSIPKKTVSSSSSKSLIQGADMSQSLAVRKNVEVKVGEFQFLATPSGFNKDLVADRSVKRFHGSRLLYSWLPQEFFQNNTDRFGYMFPQSLKNNVLPFTDINRKLLEALGEEMGNKDDVPEGGDSEIPSGYTYLGQFIDHDITLDVNSDISKFQNASKIPNMRSPSLDLDAIYGEGPALDAFLYDHRGSGELKGIKLLLGSNKENGSGGRPEMMAAQGTQLMQAIIMMFPEVQILLLSSEISEMTKTL